MPIDFDGEPEVDQRLPLQERLQSITKNMTSPKKVFLWEPAGSCQIVEIQSVIGLEVHMLNILNQLGEMGWEAFHSKEEGLKIHWVLKRPKD